MTKVFNFRQQIKHFSEMFDKRTYQTFQVVVDGIAKIRDWKQSDLACLSDKTLRQIQYFFDKAKWSFEKLNEFRLRFVRNKADFRDRKSDFAVLDGSTMKKDSDANFGNLTDYVYSTKDGKSVNGFHLYGASVQTKTGRKYILDFMLFFKSKWWSEFDAWISFATKVVAKSKAWILVLDRGFRNKYLIKHIYHKLKRMFLARLCDTQHVILKWRKKSKSIKSFLSDENAIQLEKGKMWIIQNVIINSWKDVFKDSVTVIVYHGNGFRNPLVICVSQAEMTLAEAIFFVQLYFRRWKIEQLFKELKSYFRFEKFKVLSLEAIKKYLYIAILVHSLFVTKESEIENIPILEKVFLCILKAKRNIEEITAIGVKLVLEMLSFDTSFKSIIRLLQKKKLTLPYDFL
jgi:hypothetical protein